MTDTKQKGIVYLVGAGPGDPGLMTMRGMQVLRHAEVLVYDYLANPSFIKEVPEYCERIYVGKKAGAHTLRQEEINALIVEKCAAGNKVVRLKGGDPFVFGRGGEEAIALHEAGLRFEIVPGVTAGIAAAAYAGIPVTQRGMTCTMTFVTGHEDPTKEDSDINWEQLAKGIGTIVFYMGVGNLPKISRQLIDNGRAPDTPVALVQWGTWAKQRTITGTLTDIANKVLEAGFKPPALIIVGEVVSLREQLNWFESRPLFGKRIVVTRSRAQVGDIARTLEELGAEVIEFPVLRIAPPSDPAPLKKAASEAGTYDWLVFTSVNGVDAFFAALHEQGLDTRALAGTKICAIGPATCSRIESQGLIIDLMPPKYIAESIMEELEKVGDVAGKRFLLPTADIARSYLPETLTAKGAEVTKIDAYATVLEEPDNIDEIRKALREGLLSAITFASSSTVRNFVQLVGEETFKETNASVLLASIGPETSKTLRQYTNASFEEAEQYTIPGLVDLLTNHFC